MSEKNPTPPPRPPLTEEEFGIRPPSTKRPTQTDQPKTPLPKKK